MRVSSWIAEPPGREVDQAVERLTRLPDVEGVALMPDVHLASDVCIGVVLATRDRIYPQAVGGDIGCGVSALRTSGDASCLEDPDPADRVLRALAASVPVLKRRREDVGPLPPAADSLSHGSLRTACAREGVLQLGTLGRGNHFLELQADEDDRLWIMVHSGSRGMGQRILAHHRDRASGRCHGLDWIEAADEEGARYLRDAAWALDYAEANRLAILGAASVALERELGVDSEAATHVSCHHNHVRREVHGGRSLWVHRKGAISAREGEPGLIPGSMGTPSYHVAGRGCAPSFCSSSHGAGRRMARGEARRRISVRAFEGQLRGVWFDRRRADGLRDEAPSAYKDIAAVMRAQRPLTRIVRKLRPLLSFKGA